MGERAVTLIKLEGDSPFSVPSVQHVSAVAQGENVNLTIYANVPGHSEFVPVQAQLNFRTADDLLAQLARAVADAAKHRKKT
jgi:hypothetical protein